MAKFTDLDPSHKCTLVINLTALDLATKLLHAAAQGEITLPKGLSVEELAKTLHIKALEELESEDNSIQKLCDFLDGAIAKRSAPGLELVTKTKPHQKSHKSNRN